MTADMGSDSDKQAAIVEGYGATPINYRTQAVADYVEQYTNGAGFDVVYDSVGGANMSNSFAAAALNGQVASTDSLVEIDLSEAHFKGLSLHVVFMLIPMLHDHHREVHGEILATLADAVADGALKPLLDDNTFSLDHVADAYARLASGEATGKVVIEV